MERAELAGLLGPRDAPLGPEPVFIGDRDRAAFMERFARAAAGRGPVFLGDPGWSRDQQARWQPPVDHDFDPERGWLMIPTGGSGGGLRFVRHDQDTLAAAVEGFCRHFDVTQVNAVGVLPLYHVSGLLAWVRCALTGGRYLSWDWKAIEAGDRPHPGDGRWMISLVPTQLQRLLGDADAVAWLRAFDLIFLGGGPAWPALTDVAAAAGLRISLSYGMTETAAMITALRPEEFLAGSRSSGRPLPHARIRVAGDGGIHVAADSLFRGYHPNWREPGEFETGDVGRIDEHGYLHVHGRRDAAIISGGKKIYPTEVEALLRASGEFDDVAVIGLPDPEWGEIVVACHPAGRTPNPERANAALPGYQRPKRFVALREWPRNEQGKVNRRMLREIVERMVQ